jgi:hypothetical protein
MVLVEGLKRAGKDVTREKFISAIESIHEMKVGLGPRLQRERPRGLRLGLSNHGEERPRVKNGQPELLTDWPSLGKGDRDRFSSPEDDTTPSNLRSGTLHLTAGINPIQHK